MKLSFDSSDVKSVLWAEASRKHGVMEAYCDGRKVDENDKDRLMRIVMDDVDTGEKNLSAIIEELLEGTPRNVGVVMVVDSAGIRKVSHLKKKGALVLSLSLPGKDAVVRWARRNLLPESPSEEDHEKLKSLLKATRHSIQRLKKAYETDQTAKDVLDDIYCSAPENVDNATTLVRLFSSKLSVDWLLETVGLDGGSMLGQLAWHNAEPLMEEDDYVSALSESLAGMVLERAAHLKHDPYGTALGHALSLSPYAGRAPKAERGSMTYTTTMAHGGARAVARRALAAIDDDRSVAERAWDACQVPATRKRGGRKKAAPVCN